MNYHDVFEEWDAYARGKNLINRAVEFQGTLKSSKLKILSITGIRRSGKTSLLILLRQWLEDQGVRSAYINLEDDRIQKHGILDEIIKWYGDRGILLLDEITAANGWDGWLARMHEQTKDRLQIIVSSSRGHLMTPAKPLRGRMLQLELFPLSFSEFMRFKEVRPEKTLAGLGVQERLLLEYLKYGGFPEVVLAQLEPDKLRILGSYFRDIVGLDIAQAANQHASEAKLFSQYVLQSTYFSASKCLNYFKSLGMKIGKESLLRLESVAEDGYLFFFVPIFSHSIKDRRQYSRKAYSGDTGFFYSLVGRMEMGRLFENAVFLHLRRQGAEICYWKHQGLDVDFLCMKGATVDRIIQVVYDLNESTRKRELDALAVCASEFKKTEGMVITKEYDSTEMYRGVQVRFIPLVKWLQQKP